MDEQLALIDINSLWIRFKDTEILLPVHSIDFSKNFVTYMEFGRQFEVSFNQVEFLACSKEEQ